MRPSSSAVRRSPTTGARRPRCPHTAQDHVGVAGPAPPAPRRRRPVGDRERAGADACTWRRAAALAGQRGGVPQPGRLHEHRPALQTVLDRLVGGPREPDAAGERVARELGVAGAGDLDGDPLPQRLARHRQLVRPAGLEQLVGLDRAGEPGEQGGRTLPLGADQQRLAGVGVGRARLGVQVVAVVPDRDQPEVAHRGERGGSGADHDPAGAARDGEEVAVAAGRTGSARSARRADRGRAPRSGRRPRGRRPWRRARRAGRRGRTRRTSPPRRGRAGAASPPPAACPRRRAASRRRRAGAGRPRPAGARPRLRRRPRRRMRAAPPAPAVRRARWPRGAAARRGGARRCACRRTARRARPRGRPPPG